MTLLNCSSYLKINIRNANRYVSEYQNRYPQKIQFIFFHIGIRIVNHFNLIEKLKLKKT